MIEGTVLDKDAVLLFFMCSGIPLEAPVAGV